MVISTPLISVGYLVIFLIMQPDASRRVSALLKRLNWFQEDPAELARRSLVLETTTSRLSIASNAVPDDSECMSENGSSIIYMESIISSSRMPSYDVNDVDGNNNKLQEGGNLFDLRY